METFLPDAVAPLMDSTSAASQDEWATTIREVCEQADCVISSQAIHQLPEPMRMCLDDETATSLAPHVYTALSLETFAREKLAAQMFNRPRVVVPEGREGLREIYLLDALYTLHKLHEHASATIAPAHGIRATLGFGDQWRAYVALALQVSPVGLVRNSRCLAPISSAVYSLIGVRGRSGGKTDVFEREQGNQR
jgi:hypothetical protein